MAKLVFLILLTSYSASAEHVPSLMRDVRNNIFKIRNGEASSKLDDPIRHSVVGLNIVGNSGQAATGTGLIVGGCILTAGHNVEDNSVITARVGSDMTKNGNAWSLGRVTKTKVLGNSIPKDIAILKLATPPPMGLRVPKTALASKKFSSDEKSELLLMGFGNSVAKKENSSGSGIKRFAHMKFMKHTGKDAVMNFEMNDSERTALSGDSGASYLLKKEDGSYEIVAVHSGGFNKNKEDDFDDRNLNATGGSAVAFHRDEILDAMKELDCDAEPEAPDLSTVLRGEGKPFWNIEKLWDTDDRWNGESLELVRKLVTDQLKKEKLLSDPHKTVGVKKIRFNGKEFEIDYQFKVDKKDRLGVPGDGPLKVKLFPTALETFVAKNFDAENAEKDWNNAKKWNSGKTLEQFRELVAAQAFDQGDLGGAFKTVGLRSIKVQESHGRKVLVVGWEGRIDPDAATNRRRLDALKENAPSAQTGTTEILLPAD